MKKLMVAFAVAMAMAFGALADIVITTGALSGGANQLDTSRDLIFGKVPVSVQNNKEGLETSNTDRTVLTDGIANNTKNDKGNYVDSIYTVGKAVIVYSLGDNATGYDVDEVICHFGWGDTARAKVTCSKIRYAKVEAPDTFVDAGITASAGGSGANNYVKFAFKSDSVLKGVCKIEMTLIDGRSGYGTDYCGVLELIVNGTECEPVQYFELNDIPVVNAETRSTAFLNGTDLAFVSTPSVAGAQKWTHQDVFDFDALGTATWSAIEDFPEAFSFTRPAADADVFVWYWFDSDEEGCIKRVARTAPMRYTTVKPAVSTVESLVRTVRGGTVRVEVSECDTGTTGGVSSGDGLESLDIPVLTNLLELVSGPGADLDPDPSVVTVSETGSYVLRFISYNAAGNCATNDIPYTVDTLPVGVTFTWTGAESTDWYAPGNWDRGCFPVATDDLVIPAGCSNYPRLGAIDHPRDGGAYGSLAVAEGASIAFAGDPSFVNEPSGGTAAKPHGRGPSLSCASADIDGTLTADHLGFPGSTGPSQNGDVAGHGNAGCIEHPNLADPPNYQTFGKGLVAYGNPLEPTALGSGGQQGAGGGAIKLVCAGDFKLDGTITASSTKRGAGGSIWLVCGGEFSGTGAVRADAPTLGDRSSSGGRIAIYHGSSTFTGTVSAAGGWTGQLWSNGGVGTLYEPGRYPLGTAENPADITFDGGFNYVFANEEPHYWNLTVTPGSRGGFKAGNLHLGDFAMGGDLTYLEFGTFVPGQARDMQTLEFDSITLTDSAILRLPGGYNGARKFAMSSLSIGPSARLNTGLNDWSYVDEAHGGTASAPLGRGVEIACERATIDGVLSVSCQGYGLGYGPNPNQDNGSGHGGVAASQNNIGQRGYGSFSAPTTLGCCYTGDGVCFGGGAVRLSVSDTLALSGTISADSNGRGSGGSVWIVANHFTGSGKLTASSADARRPGAGGRIAIEAVDDQFKGTIAVKVGVKRGDNMSYPGTVFRSTAPSFSAIDFDVGAEKLTSSYTKNVFNSSVESDWNNVAFDTQFVINRQITSWKGTSYAWTESCGLASGKTVANTATYVLDNLTPGAKARITVNGETTSQRVDADGKLTFTADIAAGGTDVEVRFLNGLVLLIR